MDNITNDAKYYLLTSKEMRFIAKANNIVMRSFIDNTGDKEDISEEERIKVKKAISKKFYEEHIVIRRLIQSYKKTINNKMWSEYITDVIVSNGKNEDYTYVINSNDNKLNNKRIDKDTDIYNKYKGNTIPNKAKLLNIDKTHKYINSVDLLTLKVINDLFNDNGKYDRDLSTNSTLTTYKETINPISQLIPRVKQRYDVDKGYYISNVEIASNPDNPDAPIRFIVSGNKNRNIAITGVNTRYFYKNINMFSQVIAYLGKSIYELENSNIRTFITKDSKGTITGHKTSFYLYPSGLKALSNDKANATRFNNQFLDTLKEMALWTILTDYPLGVSEIIEDTPKNVSVNNDYETMEERNKAIMDMLNNTPVIIEDNKNTNEDTDDIYFNKIFVSLPKKIKLNNEASRIKITMDSEIFNMFRGDTKDVKTKTKPLITFKSNQRPLYEYLNDVLSIRKFKNSTRNKNASKQGLYISVREILEHVYPDKYVKLVNRRRYGEIYALLETGLKDNEDLGLILRHTYVKEHGIELTPKEMEKMTHNKSLLDLYIKPVMSKKIKK